MSLVSPDYRVEARDFSRGYVDSPETDTLHPGATPDAKNCWFFGVEVGPDQKRATTGKRPGSRLINPTPISAGQPVDLWEFTREGAAGELLAACAGAWSVYDEVNAFTPIAGATGYTPGNAARVVVAKNQALLHDGSKMQLYDGATVRDVGFAKPTGLTNLAVAAGPGVTGTYSARYTWYDQLHDHESSPTVGQTANQAFANQQRTHTKPAGAPPSQVTHWRAYVRREDTSESYWFRVATVPIGNATHTEAVIDAARVDRLPLEAENDPPGVVFAFCAYWNGYAVGFAEDSSEAVFSKQGDIEAYNPKDRFRINPGDGKPVRAALTYGSDLLLQKPHRSFRFVGSRVPFEIQPIHGSFGNVSHEAGGEVKGQFFGWDEIKGPYWTDLVNWEPIADFRIERLMRSVHRQQLRKIEFEHDEARSLVLWAIPTIGSTRIRTIVAYHYVLGVWLPPITGLEYTSLAQYTTTAGQLGVYAGDEWGRVWQLFDGTREGPPTGTVRGTVTSATSTTLTDSAAAFYTTGAGLAGMPIAVRSPAGVWQWRRIESNTGDTITLDTTHDSPWTTTPAAGPGGPEWEYCVGGIQWYRWTPWLDMRAPQMLKRGGWLEVQLKPTSAQHALDVHARFNDDEGVVSSRDMHFETGLIAGVWGVSLWGVAMWGGQNRRMRKARIARSFFTIQLVFSNFWPDQPIELTTYAVSADALPRRRVGGASG